MRIATWNVNSLKARQEAVDNWLERAAPDILLMQETKLGDADAPVMAFAMAGYQLVHHGEGRWNGVAIAARNGLAIDDVVTNFGDGPVRDSGPGGDGRQRGRLRPVRRGADARRDGRRACASSRVYAPNGRVVGSPFYEGKLAWFERLGRWLDDERAAGRGDQLVVGGDFNVAPADIDVWDPAAAHGGTHVSRAGAGGRPRAARPRPDRRLPRPPRRGRPLHVVGLPGRHVPQELRDADRPAAGGPGGRGAPRRRRDRPRRRARDRRSRPTTRRWRSTSTSPASRSTRTGRARSPGSRRARGRRQSRRARDVADDGTMCTASHPPNVGSDSDVGPHPGGPGRDPPHRPGKAVWRRPGGRWRDHSTSAPASSSRCWARRAAARRRPCG